LPVAPVDQFRPAAMVNILGSGSAREAHLHGIDRVLEAPGVSIHLYDKRRVFERRKMGHLTVVAALGESAEEALQRGRAAAAGLTWAD
jgi:5-(carboxyamino)imidazole ribonucleotide synthase